MVYVIRPSGWEAIAIRSLSKGLLASTSASSIHYISRNKDTNTICIKQNRKSAILVEIKRNENTNTIYIKQKRKSDIYLFTIYTKTNIVCAISALHLQKETKYKIIGSVSPQKYKYKHNLCK